MPTNPQKTPRHGSNLNSTRWRVVGRNGMEEGVLKGNRGWGRMCRTTRRCVSHTPPHFLSFFVGRGSVHVACCLFPPPPSHKINDETVCIPHAASFSFFPLPLPQFLQQGAAYVTHTLPHFFYSFTPHQRGGFYSSGNDDGAARNPHAAPRFTSFTPHWGEIFSVLLTTPGRCVIHTSPHSIFFTPPLVGGSFCPGALWVTRRCVTHMPSPFHFVQPPCHWGGFLL